MNACSRSVGVRDTPHEHTTHDMNTLSDSHSPASLIDLVPTAIFCSSEQVQGAANASHFGAEMAHLRPFYRTAPGREWPDTAPGSRFPTEYQNRAQPAKHDNRENAPVTEAPVTHQRALANASSDKPKGRSVASNLAVFVPVARP